MSVYEECAMRGEEKEREREKEKTCVCVNATLMKCIRHGKKERHNLHIHI